MTAPLADNLTEFEVSKRCETTVVDCPNEAAWAVWCDHHAQGCDYSGFRCDLHFNVLMLETHRLVERLRRDWDTFCANCGAVMSNPSVEAHTRGIRL